jgi:hypothetical protein
MARDIIVVVILSAILVALALAQIWLTKYVWTGMASIHVAFWYFILELVCLAIGGALINRLWLGITGLTILWIGSVVVDAATASEASFVDVAISSLILISIQFSVFIAAWWMTAKDTVHGQ